MNGYAATLLCDTAAERAITWSDGGSSFTVISHDLGGPALSVNELLLIVRSVH